MHRAAERILYDSLYNLFIFQIIIETVFHVFHFLIIIPFTLYRPYGKIPIRFHLL